MSSLIRKCKLVRCKLLREGGGTMGLKTGIGQGLDAYDRCILKRATGVHGNRRALHSSYSI